MMSNDDLLSYYIFLAVVGVLMSLVLFVFIFIILIKFYKFLFRNKHVFGSTLSARIISLAIATIFVSQGIILLFLEPTLLTFNAIIGFYSDISQIYDENTRVVKLISGLSFQIKNLAQNLNDSFLYFDIGELVMFMAIWVGSAK